MSRLTERAMPAADINVTPLIDVMLVLLIIFMVVTPLAHRGLDAQLPSPRSSPPADARPGAGAERIGLLPREANDR